MTPFRFPSRVPVLFLANRGFTLIEVLVSMGILSIGLAGLAAMDVLTFRKTNDSYMRSQAILQAHEMAARMHANPLGVENGDYDDLAGNGANPPTPNCIDRSSELIGAASACYNADIDTDAERDTAAQNIANFDADEWLDSTKTMLPAGAGGVAAPGSVPHCPAGATATVVSQGIYTISVSWEESVSQESVASGIVARCFNFDFRPLP